MPQTSTSKSGVAVAVGVRVGVAVGWGVGVGVRVGVAVGTGVFVGGTGVLVGGTGVAVGGTGVAVGGTGVAVAATGVAVAGAGVAVGPGGVAVAGVVAVAVADAAGLADAVVLAVDDGRVPAVVVAVGAWSPATAELAGDADGLRAGAADGDFLATAEGLPAGGEPLAPCPDPSPDTATQVSSAATVSTAPPPKAISRMRAVDHGRPGAAAGAAAATAAARDAPQLSQKLAPAVGWVPQFGQNIRPSSCVRGPGPETRVLRSSARGRRVPRLNGSTFGDARTQWPTGGTPTWSSAPTCTSSVPRRRASARPRSLRDPSAPR